MLIIFKLLVILNVFLLNCYSFKKILPFLSSSSSSSSSLLLLSSISSLYALNEKGNSIINNDFISNDDSNIKDNPVALSTYLRRIVLKLIGIIYQKI